MPRKTYHVNLSVEEDKSLRDITHKGNSHSAKKIPHANILLLTNERYPDKKRTNQEVADIFGVSKTTVSQIRKTYAKHGMEAALTRKTRLTPPVASKITGDLEAHVLATALSPPPEGYAKWTLRLLAEHCLENQYLVSVSHTTIGDMLNTNELKPHLSKYWCIPKLNDAAFVANMEDVPTIYEMPYNPEIPVICMDEKPIQLLDEIRERIQAKPIHTDPDTQLPQPGYCEKIDSGYVRCGTASIFMFTEPLGGWRHVLAKEHRKRGDFAQMMLTIAEKYYPDVKRTILAADNLNTHSRASFYEAFKPSIACWLSQKYEFHYTPKHGSWLNMAETELSSLSIQCLGNQRIKEVEHLNEVLGAWEVSRNRRQKGIIWQFKTGDARTKLYRLYPETILDA